jgi:hypothetical protein
LVVFVLPTIEPHEEDSTEYRQNQRDSCIHNLGSNPY